MLLLFWIIVFIVSLVALVKGADWLLLSAERIGLSLGLSPFIIGVTIVGIGTGLPEMVSGVVAVISGVKELPVANAVGSNVANILLVIGVMAIWSRRIVVKKNLIDLDLPLLAVVTLLFLFMAFEGTVTLAESILLLIIYGIYLVYTIIERKETDEDVKEIIESLPEEVVARPRWWKFWKYFEKVKPPKIEPIDWIRLIVGVIALALGANYVVDSVVELSAILDIGAGIIALAAIAFGTSLPELIVSLKAANHGKPEVALGNIIGSSVFNLLMVVGVAGLFGTLDIDASTLHIGIPFMLAATFLFIVSGISRRIHIWEGSMYVLLYGLFIGKVFGLL